MGFLTNWFGRFRSASLNKQTIGEYLARVGKHELAAIVYCATTEPSQTATGLLQQIEGEKILERHKALFANCRSGTETIRIVCGIADRWPDISSKELALLSDLTEAHKSLRNIQAQP